MTPRGAKTIRVDTLARVEGKAPSISKAWRANESRM